MWALVPFTWWLVIPSALVLGYWSWICAVITHNTIHHPIFRSKPLNKTFQVMLTLSYGHPVSAFVPGHNLSHHRFTQKPQDVMRTTKVDLGWNLLNVIAFVPAVALSIMRTDMAFIRAMKEKRPRWYRQLVLEWAILGVVSVALIVLDWRRFLAFFFVPHMMAAFGIIGINYLQHDGCDEDHPYNHSRNFTSRWFGWLTFNNGYHGIHHMQPSLHWSLLPEAHDRLVRPHIDPRLDQPSILAYAWRNFVWPGKRLRYDGQPVEVTKVPDESWLTRELPADASYGAEQST